MQISAINDFKHEFDGIFIQELNNLIQTTEQNVKSHAIKRYTDYIRTIAANGKRIRPYNSALTFTIYSGRDWREIKNTLVGVELVHLMALIHDDIMDNSHTRHGVLSMHSYVKDDLLKLVNAPVAEHTSRSLAILLGDLVFAWAYAKFSEDTQTKESWNIINALLQEVIIGQMMDVYNPIEKKETMEQIENKMLLKTARYTFTRPLQLGTACAGSTSNKTSWVNNFGDSAGLLFQMQDDVFDITKDAQTLKKDPLGDVKNGIHTLMSVYVAEHATEDEIKKWSTWFGNSEINNQNEIQSFLDSVGAFAFAQKFIDQKEAEALTALSESGLSTTDTDTIKALLSAITHRKY